MGNVYEQSRGQEGSELIGGTNKKNGRHGSSKSWAMKYELFIWGKGGRHWCERCIASMPLGRPLIF